MKQLLRTVILALLRVFGLPGALKAAHEARIASNTAGAPRILLIRPDHLGDLVLTTPVLARD